MSELILVTGFLGAGKTSLLKELMQHYADRRLRLIVNEFGGRGVDGSLLRDLGAAVAEIDNGSIFCVCRVAEFEEALRQAAQQGDMIIVEASGLSDPLAIQGIVAGIPGIRYLGAIAVADAGNVHKLLHTSRAAARQLSISSLILLNKCDLVDEDRLRENEALLKGRCPFARIERSQFARVAPEWLSALRPGQGHDLPPQDPDLALQKVLLTVSEDMPSGDLLHFLKLFAEDSNRVKGILRLKEGVFLVDCVGAAVQVSPYPGQAQDGNWLSVLAGHGLPLRPALALALAAFWQHVEETPA